MRSLIWSFGRAALERLLESHAANETAVAVANTRIVELEKALATERARFEWLSVHVNELKTERSILLERVLEVQMPVMQIAREDPPATEPARRRLSQEDLRRDVAYAPPPPQGERGQVFKSPAERKDAAAMMAEALAAGDLFNDVGDERARDMGLGWDPEGSLVTDVPPAIAASR